VKYGNGYVMPVKLENELKDYGIATERERVCIEESVPSTRTDGVCSHVPQ